MCEVTHTSRGPDVLGKQNALSLNDEEVDELVDVANNGVQGFLGNSVVAAGTELGDKAAVEEDLSGRFGGNGGEQGQPSDLEGPAEQIEVPNREDERHRGRIGDGRGTWRRETRQK